MKSNKSPPGYTKATREQLRQYSSNVPVMLHINSSCSLANCIIKMAKINQLIMPKNKKTWQNSIQRPSEQSPDVMEVQ